MVLETIKTWVPAITGAIMAAVGAGLVPHCGDFQTKSLAKVEHKEIQESVSKLRDTIYQNRIDVIREIQQVEKVLTNEIRVRGER